jgi:NAD-dependent SIR2 family protein deacetylase
MPDDLVAAVAAGNTVLFAGAGISTESPLVAPYTLFGDLAGRMDLDPAAQSFPAVMTAYSGLHGRAALLQAIRDRLEYVKSFPELQGRATAFHRELSTIHFIEDIVTTNWDTSFEDACGALPIVVPEDYAFWNAPGRKVFKIHGSITNWGTVVATEADYRSCYRRLRDGVVGASLKHLLATKSVIFVGYSLGDSDFARIYGFLKKEMGEVLPRSYIVTLDDRVTSQTHPGSVVLHTSGEYFLAQLKERLMQTGCLLDDRVFGAVIVKHHELFDEHMRLSEVVCAGAARRALLPRLSGWSASRVRAHAGACTHWRVLAPVHDPKDRRGVQADSAPKASRQEVLGCCLRRRIHERADVPPCG